MIEQECKNSNQPRSHQIRSCKAVKTRARTYNRYNLGVIRNSGGKENHRNKYQNRHESDDQIHDPVRIEIDKEFRYGKSV